MHVVVLNGSIRGGAGDSGVVCARIAERVVGTGGSVDVVVLGELAGSVTDVAARVGKASAFVIVTGTYWGSWGSPLQRFFEMMTPYEASGVFLGKACGAVVTMDSVSGAEVGARLLSTMNLLGCAVVPLGLVALSRVSRLIDGRADADEAWADIWRPDDIDTLVDNVMAYAAVVAPAVAVWDKEDVVVDGAYPAPGLVNVRLRQGVFGSP